MSIFLFSSCSVMSNALPPHGQQHSRFASELPFCSSSSPLSPWCHLTISSSVVPFLLPSIFPSIRVFSSELALHIRWPKYWSLHFSVSLSNEYSGLISFRIDWSPCCPRDSRESSPAPQFKSINSSALSLSYFPLSHLYMTTGKTIALTIQNQSVVPRLV